jgi:hypothetical protein
MPDFFFAAKPLSPAHSGRHVFITENPNTSLEIHSKKARTSDKPGFQDTDHNWHSSMPAAL